MSLTTIAVVGVVFLINFMFGYWRANTRRFSKEWMLAIHAPVLISIVLRLVFLGWSWLLLPAFVATFAIGQFSGGQFRKILMKGPIQPSSVLLVDLLRALSQTFRKTVA